MPRSFRFTGIFVGIIAAIAVFWFLNRSTMTSEEFRIVCKATADAEDWEQLSELAIEWAAQSEDPGEALVYLAEGQSQSDCLEEAVATLLEIPPKSEQSYAALIKASQLQFEVLNKPLEGMKTLNLMAAQRPNSIETRRRIIFFYGVTLQRQKMLLAIYDAIGAAAEPIDAFAYLMIADELAFSNGFTSNTDWLRSSPGEELFEVARIVHLIHMTMGQEKAKAQLAAALTEFDRLRKKYPQNLNLIRVGIASAVRKYNLAAVEALVKDVSEDTTDGVLLRQTAWLHFEKGRHEQSQELLHRSLVANPLDWNTWNQLAICVRRLGDSAYAEKAAQNATEGKALQKEILQLENTSQIDTELLQRIGKYAANCGESRVSNAILAHFLAKKP